MCTLGDGVIVGQGDWQGRLDDHRQAYAKHVVASADFAARFPATQTAALRKVAESDSLRRAEPDPTFVLMEHFGYWRRDPDEAGSNFWLTKLEQFGGNYSEAEMVKAFLSSIEHRRRFA